MAILVNPLPLKGKTVLITGASRRIGACTARFLHGAGAHLALHYRKDQEGAQALAAELEREGPGSVRCYGADLREVAALEAMVAAVVADFGGLDALVNNASSFFPTPLGSIDEAAWDDLVGSNFKAPLFLSQAVAPHLRQRQGVIVNITDVHAERPLAGYALYSAAKGALLTLTRALAQELGPEVRVNAVAPGAILWPEDGQLAGPERQAIVDHSLLKREGSPEDIARAVRFLLAEAPYVTGQVINVDGGRTAHL
ncbi:pteridine reductase [Azovibrio restrictus]|uniref:pteridine reductase n=1 Tax=Azovibrio restrictus TaxID=146938 RepID=UPI00040E1B50|nr:pteridine reductase [Azovibrio restrictus]MCE1171892.1 pteridine reductase [Azovibrio sp.]